MSAAGPLFRMCLSLVDAGAGAESPEDEAELARVLVPEAERFLRAGGCWDAAAWAEMTGAERAAASAAGDRLWRVRTSVLLRGLGAPDAAAEILAPVDGGEAVEDAALDRALRVAVARAGQERPT